MRKFQTLRNELALMNINVIDCEYNFSYNEESDCGMHEWTLYCQHYAGGRFQLVVVNWDCDEIFWIWSEGYYFPNSQWQRVREAVNDHIGWTTIQPTAK